MIAVPKFEGEGYEVEPLDLKAVEEIMQIAYEMNGQKLSGDFWARVVLNALSEPGFPVQTVVFHEKWLVQSGDGVVAIAGLDEQALNNATVSYILRTDEMKNLGVSYEQRGNVTIFFKRQHGRRGM